MLFIWKRLSQVLGALLLKRWHLERPDIPPEHSLQILVVLCVCSCVCVCVCVRACVCFRLKINYLSVDTVQLCSLTTECPSSSSTQSLRIYYMEQFTVMYLNMTYVHTHIHTSAHISYIDGVHNRCWRCPPSSCWHNSTRLFIFHETRLKIVGLIQFTACEIAFLGSFSVRALSV